MTMNKVNEDAKMLKQIHDIKEALENGAQQIEQLRRHNEMLSIKAQAFDAMAGLVTLLVPRQSHGEGVDGAWIMRKLLADIKREESETARGGIEQ